MTDAARALLLRLQTCANRPDAIVAAMHAVLDGARASEAADALEAWEQLHTDSVQEVAS